MRGVGRSLFPVGLYASLLVALLALLRPQLTAPLEAALSAVAALPFRAYGDVVPRAVHAGAGDIDRSRARCDLFWERARDGETSRWPLDLGGRWVASTCRVRTHDADSGRFELWRTWADVEACAEFVTVGDALVGFLGERGAADDFATVELLARERSVRSRTMRGVPARVDVDGVTLRFVVEAAASIDPWPLRAELIDDPYLAASLQQDGFEVTTSGFADDPLGAVPPGLALGTLRIWGYERDGRRLPIGFFVDPVRLDGTALVTLWSRQRIPSAAREPVWDTLPLEAYALSDTGSRWFARVPFGRGALREGTQIVRGERLVGQVTSAGHGYAFVTPLGAEGSRLDAWMVTEHGAPVHVEWRVVASTETEIGLRAVRGRVEAVGGSLFTDSSDGSPGLWIGDAEPGPVAGTFVLSRAASPSAGGLAALVATGGGP